LLPLHRVNDNVGGAAVLLTEDQAIELPCFGCVSIGHQVPVAVEGRLDRGVTELRLDVLRVRLSLLKTRLS
jgi:hypothetical protein